MKKIILLIALFIQSISLFSETNVSGFISTNTTWNVTGNPYIVVGSVIVNSGVTLSIDPGVIVKFNTGFAIRIDGTLKAIGSSSNKIVFTSNSPYPQPGNWAYLLFTNSSTDAIFDNNGTYLNGCILKFCDLSYGGSIVDKGIVTIEESSPYINYCTIQSSGSSGIYIAKSRSRVENNKFISNNKYGLFYNNYNFLVSYYTKILVSNNECSFNLQDGLRFYWMSADTVNIINNIVKNNHGEGGIVFGSYTTWEDGGLYIKIIGNTVQNNFGTRAGGITCFRPRFAEINSNLVTNNIGNDVGGIYFHADFDPCPTSITNNTLTTNTGSSYGAMYLTYFASSGSFNVGVSGNIITNNISTIQNFPVIKFAGDQQYSHSNFIITNNVIRKNIASRTITLGDCIGYMRFNNIDSNFTTYDIFSENNASAPAFNARKNYWGTTNPVIINNRVYDFFDDPNRGVILVDSFATGPYPIGIIKESEIIPSDYFLEQNYPNPFNPVTKIKFRLPKPELVKLTIFDMLGREIETVVNEKLNAGIYSLYWNAVNFPSGIYFCQLSTFSFTITKKMVLIK